MNLRQKICLGTGIAAFVLMGLFPPWIYARLPRGVMHAGYAFILTPPRQVLKGHGPVSLDVSRLCFQWLMVTLATAGLIYTFKDDKSKKPKGEGKK